VSPLRIVHVIARLNVGGAAHHVLHLAREQTRRGHDVVVVAGSLASGEESMAYLAEELDVDVRPLPALQRELSPRADAAAISRLRAIVRERHPDVVHTHTAKAGATGRPAALLSGRSRPRALVHSYHGHVLSGYFSPGRERVFRLIERILARSTSALIAVSEEVRDDLVAYGVAPRERFDVVPYGFEPAPSSAGARTRVRAELGLAPDTFAIGWAGRLTPVKQPLELVRTLAAVRTAGVDAALVLVGDGEEREATEKLAESLGVRDRTHLVGFRRDIQDWYAAFDAVLLTSLNEGTPMVAIEALAAERPVVATDAGGTRAVVQDGVGGYLAPIGDTEALARHLVALGKDSGLRRRLGESGSAFVRERFGAGRMADQIEGIYRRGTG
jgi:glycosyltransferase involved in cell wall biosynthesis